MEISDIDLQITDLEWYGVDVEGRVARFTSGGSLAVPLSIRHSYEQLLEIAEFFENIPFDNTKEINCFERFESEENNAFKEECKIVAKKGLYCYDITADIINKYECITRPVEPLLIKELPQRINEILNVFVIEDVNFKLNDNITINTIANNTNKYD